MREFVIATESNNDMPSAFIQEHEILVIPHYYTIEEDVYGDGNELTNKEFYDEMRAGKKAGTMASNPAVILERFGKVVKEGKDILFVSFSSALSGGYSNICVGAQEVIDENPGMRIIVIDTLSASLAEGILLNKAVQCRAEGMDIDATADVLRKMVPNLGVQFTVENLDYLFRGGRLSKTSAVIGNMVNLKPILHIDEEGRLVPVNKVRGRKKSIQTMLDNIEANMGSFVDKQEFIGILHGDCEEDALYVKEQLEKRFGFTNFIVCPIGPSIGAHSGPGTLGIVYMSEKR